MTIELIIIGIALVLLFLIYNHRKKLFIKSHNMYKELQAEERKKIREDGQGVPDEEEERNMTEDHPHIRVLLRKVEHHFDNDEIGDAEICIRELLELTGNDPHMRHQMGIVYIKRGDLDAAEKLYRDLTKLKLDAKHFVNLGEVLLRQERLEEALDAYLYGLEMNREYAHNFMQAGYVYERLGQFQEAREMYQKALEIEPDNIELREHLESLQ